MADWRSRFDRLVETVVVAYDNVRRRIKDRRSRDRWTPPAPVTSDPPAPVPAPPAPPAPTDMTPGADVDAALGPDTQPLREPASPPVDPSPGEAPLPEPVAAAWVAPDGGSCPASHPVKAKRVSKIFHAPGMANYARTTPDRCYADEAAAEADGFRRAKR